MNLNWRNEVGQKAFKNVAMSNEEKCYVHDLMFKKLPINSSPSPEASLTRELFKGSRSMTKEEASSIDKYLEKHSKRYKLVEIVDAPEARVDWEKEAREIVIALAEWSRKYPKDTVHSYAYEKKCNDELYAIEERAKALSAAFEKGREAR
jgi:hypothetical protein